MIHVGVTGTREGMTEQQKHIVVEWLDELRNKEACLHHGDCIGVDEEVNGLARQRGIVTEAHPPVDRRYRAFSRSVITHKPRPYLDRDQDIVDIASILIAVPQGPERVRSGTWATVRMARKAGKPINIIWPNGVVTMEDNSE